MCLQVKMSIFNLYEDDGETIEYKEGKYNVIPLNGMIVPKNW